MMRALMKRVVRGVRHDVEKSQFVCEVRRNNTAQMLGCLMYNINGGDMDLYFTHELRAGRGVARALCDEAFKYANDHDLVVNPIYSYVQNVYLPDRATARSATSLLHTGVAVHC
ncbi:hypothetical protein H257_02819 [Aphanomyces astaci]|uniref:Uncharacterized protein n=1 Tax=Aphanomyces astaci TaxID=112090 RepID=W4GZ31_APHAT|nr:hypothetical protein H257_02819 [Aphanomyces astaci]ETV84922.1 hypothetical protein H257_02819 [Aphanomyces astaci]|eukprot:XP_009824940.1 hypothetical protein H257_02819 [Aphanomyces astaci]